MMSPWENITAQLSKAREASMLNTNKFAIQDSLDAAFAQRQIEEEAKIILEDPVLFAQIMREGGSSSDGLPAVDTGRSPISIGIGARTDEIKKDALIAAVKGLFTGGIGGAVMGGAKSYVLDTGKTLFDINRTQDPIAALNALQRWTPAPVETRTGQTPAQIAQEQREAEVAAVIRAQQAAEQAAPDAARNVQPVSTYTPSGNASDWSPVDSNNNISWSGQTYSPSAYEGLMP